MRPLRPKRHVVDLLFTVALFCVFAASAMMVVLIGAEVYKGTVQGMNDNFNTQTSLTYVAAKIRQNDTAGGISIQEYNGTSALALDQTVGESVYRTLIYQYEGKLMELFAQRDMEMELSTGNPIMDVSSFEMESLGGGLFRFTCVGAVGSKPTSVTVRVNCLEGGPAV